MMRSKYDNISIPLITLGSIVMVISLVLTSSNGQSNQNLMPGFKLYENADYNISIQYPTTWDISEQDLPANGIVQLKAPDTKDQSTSAILLVANYQMPKNTTLDEFVDYFFKERYKNSTDYKLISSSNTILAGLSGRQFILYDYDKDILGIESTGKVMRLIAFDNNTSNGYLIKYWAQPSLYNKYLPLVQKMINSFKITSNSSSKTFQPKENTGNSFESASTPSSESSNQITSGLDSSIETGILNDQYSYTDANPKLSITEFKLVDYNTRRSSIIGEVMNNTTDPIQNIHITSSVYNLKNQLIAAGDTNLDIDQLRPGEKAGFEIVLKTKVTGSKRVNVSTDYQLADLLKPGFLKITLGKLHEENRRLSDYERFTVVGEVTNLGPDASSNVKVIGLFFDKKHNLVDYEYSRLKSNPLMPAQKAPFETFCFF